LIFSVTEIHQDGFVIPIESQRKGLCSGARLNVYFPGFPTLKHLEHTVKSVTDSLSSYFAITALLLDEKPIATTRTTTLMAFVLG